MWGHRRRSCGGQGVREMKARSSHRRGDRVSGNEQVRVEMQTFLAALASYPDRFAVNPQVTFEEHRVSLMPPTVPENGSPRDTGVLR